MNDRRKFLKKVGAASTVGVIGFAGCTSNNGSGSQSGGSNNGSGSQSGGSNNDSGSQNGGSKTVLKWASDFSSDHPQVKIMKRWSNNLSKKTNERITIQHIQIGGEEDQIQAVSSGSISMQGTSMGSLTQKFGKEYGFLEAPFVATSWDQFLAMAKKWVYPKNEFNDQLIKKGNQRILGASYRGKRGVTSNKVITKPADVQGLQMRLPQFDTWVKSWGEIGVNPTPVAADELYQGLKTGTVDASEGPIRQFVDLSLYEVQTNFSQTDHLIQSYQWVIHEPTWQSFSTKTQSMMKKTLNEAIKWGNELTRSDAKDLVKKVGSEKKYDTKVTPREKVDQKAFQKAAEPQIKKFFDNRWKVAKKQVDKLAKS